MKKNNKNKLRNMDKKQYAIKYLSSSPVTIKKELISKRKKWYSNIAVKFELLKAMRDREVIFMDRIDNWKCIRGLRIRNIPSLDFLFDYYNFLTKDYNIYVSVAKYSNIPTFDLNLKNRSNQTKKWFREIAQFKTIDYDLFLDFDLDDNKNWNKLKKEVFEMAQTLDNENIRFNIYPSGNGFQINIPQKTIHLEHIKKITTLLKENFNLQFLDLKGIGTQPKIRKCEYSLVENKVVLPFENYKNLRNFDYNIVNSDLILGSVLLKNRGLCYKNNNLFGKKFLNKYYLEE